MGIIRSFDIRRLSPFHREGDRLPKAGPERSDELASLDPDLRPDEQSYVNHYLSYADVLLKQSQEGKDGARASHSQPSNVFELPRIQEHGQNESGQEENDDAA